MALDATHATWGATGTQIQQLKNDGYTIITVMMRSQAMVGTEYTDAKAFLQGIASPGLDGNESNTAADNKLYFEADSNSTKDVIEAFRQIANRIASGLNGYTVRDYIDPRFDVLNDAGDVLTVLDSNGQFTNATNPDVDAATGLRAFTTPDDKQAFLGYDSTKKMFYVLWKNQEIPATALESTSVNPWKSQIRIQAKEDFLGGNDILSNGNETGMNQVYYPDSADSTGMTPTNSTNRPKKDYPRTTVNPGTLDINLSNYEDTIFLGETISPESLYNSVQVKRDNAVDYRSLYFNYLLRVGEKLQGDSSYYVNLLKYASIPTGATNDNPAKDSYGNDIPDFNLVTDANGVTTLTLPYYYLENPGDVTSYAGGDLHQADKVGKVTYSWKALTTGGHTLTDNNALKDYTSTTEDTVKYQLSVSYTPDAFVGNKYIATNGTIVTESPVITDNGSVRTQTLTGQRGSDNLIRNPVGAVATAKSTDPNSQGLAVVHVVAGKIKVKKIIEISQDNWNKLVAKAGADGLTFTFTLMKDGTNYGTVSINTNNPTATVSGNYMELSSDWITNLPKGDYTLTESAMPTGFTFTSLSADTVVNADGDNNNGTQFEAPTTGSVTWHVGKVAGGSPSATTYGSTDFSYAKVNDTTKEVDPNKDKAYLNAQIGKAIVLNEPPRTTEITITKVDSVTGDALTGAKFSLKEGAAYSNLEGLTITNKTTGAAITAETISVSGVSVKVFEIPTGGIKIDGLVNGTYTLTEEVIPDGYGAIEGNRTFKAENGTVRKADDSGEYTEEDANFTFKIQNEPGAELPSTGGPGTKLIYLIGLITVFLASTGLAISRSRRRQARDAA